MFLVLLMFSVSEYQERIKNLQFQMKTHDLDLVILNYIPDSFYFSGTGEESSLVVPVDGPPTLFVLNVFEHAKEQTWIDDVRPLESFSRYISSLVEEYRPKTVGMTLDVLPANLFLKYQQVFNKMQISIKNVASLVRKIRAKKSVSEQEMIKQAARIVDSAHALVPEILQENMREIDLLTQLYTKMVSEGHPAHVFFRRWQQVMILSGHVLSGPHGAQPTRLASPNGGHGISPILPFGSSTRKIKKHEMVFIDLVGNYNGYLADETRCYSLGSISDEVQCALEATITIEERIVSLLKEGEHTKTITERAFAFSEELGYSKYFMGYYRKTPFIGHGVGLEIDELPVFTKKTDFELERGNVIAIEPKITLPSHGIIGIENTWIITEENTAQAVTKSPLYVRV